MGDGNNKFSACLIGDGTLLIQCAEKLLARKHCIQGIVSEHPVIQQWATSQAIPFVKMSDDYSIFLKKWSFDYLFSITNLTMLPPSVLALAKKLAINFHDALLPTYAGVHATSWAIYHQESSHGVSWHIMERGPDKGDIVKSKRLAIAVDETAYSLNMKCYEAGITTFAALITDIENDNLSRQRQNSHARRYFGKNKRPENEGLVCWCASAESIAAQCRAYDVGSHDNTFSVMKMAVNNDIIIIRAVEIVTALSNQEAGTITQLSQQAIQVATATNDIVITALETIDGCLLSISTFIKTYSLACGSRLLTSHKNRMADIVQQATHYYRYEAYWVKCLAIRLANIPHRLERATHGMEQPYRKFRLTASDFSRPGGNLSSPAGIFSTFLAFLQRLGEYSSQRVMVTYPALTQAVASMSAYFSPSVPFPIPALTASMTIATYQEGIEKQMARTKKHGTFARDVRARYRALKCEELSHQQENFPINIVWLDANQTWNEKKEGDFYMVIADKAEASYWWVNSHNLEQAAIVRLWEQYQTFLWSINQWPEQPVMDLPLLSREAWQEVVINNNQTDQRYPSHHCLPQLFSETAQAYPDRLAISCLNQQASYREVDEKSRQLALFLHEKGVGRGAFVGIFFERSIDMVIALLAVLKSGAAYIPLDPLYPKERLAFMMNDATMTVILATSQLVEKLPQHSASIIPLDKTWPTIENIANRYGNNGANRRPLDKVKATDLAYVIYTSGSTGQPKGVAVTHHSLTNFLYAMMQQPGINANDKMLALTTVCFDIAALELYLPLINGAQVDIVPAQLCRDGGRLQAYIAERQATIIQATPATWQMLIAADWQNSRQLKILCGGEKLLPTLAEQLLQRSDDVWNLFGPTETTIWSAVHRIKHGEKIVIGKPIANTQFYVLDANGCPVAYGMVGELYIGGDGVAQGYLNRPILNSERFIINPFTKGKAEKLYRTGDRVRYLANGTFDYLGRMDTQVKIHGYRIELGEIEAVLLQQTRVLQAVVMVSKNSRGDSGLLAYVVLGKPTTGSEMSAMRVALKSKLPAYMLPATILPLEALPRLPNGKIDRQALLHRRRESSHTDNLAPYAPLSEDNIEQAVMAVWQGVLGREAIGLHENFFDSGGNSLLLIDVMNRLMERFERSFTTTDLFRYPTVHLFSQFLLKKLDRTLPRQDENEMTMRRAERASTRHKRDGLRRKRLALKLETVSIEEERV